MKWKQWTSHHLANVLSGVMSIMTGTCVSIAVRYHLIVRLRASLGRGRFDLKDAFFS